MIEPSTFECIAKRLCSADGTPRWPTSARILELAANDPEFRQLVNETLTAEIDALQQHLTAALAAAARYQRVAANACDLAESATHDCFAAETTALELLAQEPPSPTSEVHRLRLAPRTRQNQRPQ